jgi:hypothetical protein
MAAAKLSIPICIIGIMSQIDPSQEGLFKAHEAAWSGVLIRDADPCCLP